MMELLGMKVRKKVLKLTDGSAQTEIPTGDDKKVQTEAYADINPPISRKTTFQTQKMKPAQIERSGASPQPFDDSSVE